MNAESYVFHLGRSGALAITPADALPHTDGLAPILEIVAAILLAGYSGVAVDELQLSNGRYAQAVEVNEGTPEGRLVAWLWQFQKSGHPMPNPQDVVAAIARAYGASDVGVS